MDDKNMNTKIEAFPGDNLPRLIQVTLIQAGISVALFFITYFVHPNIDKPMFFFWPLFSIILGIITALYASAHKDYGYYCSHKFDPIAATTVSVSIAVNVVFSMSCSIFFIV